MYNEVKKPVFWGIVNITPDSFSDGGLYFSPEKALSKVYEHFHECADFADLGACSTRPFASPVPPEEEWKRLENVLQHIKSENPQLLKRISIDTWQSSVAQKALEMGVGIINDVSAGCWDNKLFHVIAEYQCPYVLMHSKGKPESMQSNPSYENVVLEVKEFFEKKLGELTQLGIKEEKIILDLGIGFGKTTEHNVELLQNASEFKCFGLPLMAGISRKSLLRNICSLEKEDIPALDSATAGLTQILHTLGFTHHRVHNVKYAKRGCELAELFKRNANIN